MKLRNCMCVLILIFMSACVKNKPEVVEPPASSTNNEMLRSSVELKSSDFSGVYPTLEFSYEFSKELKLLRFYVLVDGIPSEFSLNDAGWGFCHDYDKQTEEALKFTIKASDFSDKISEEAIISVVSLINIGEIEDITVLLSEFTTNNFGVSSIGVIKEYSPNNIKMKSADFEIIPDKDDKYVGPFINGNDGVLDRLALADQNMEFRTVQNISFLYDESLKYYVTKLGYSNYYVYPLINGNFTMEDNSIMGLDFTQSEEALKRQYGEIDFKGLGLDFNDIVSYIVWDKDKQEVVMGPAFMVLDPSLDYEMIEVRP